MHVEALKACFTDAATLGPPWIHRVCARLLDDGGRDRGAREPRLENQGRSALLCRGEGATRRGSGALGSSSVLPGDVIDTLGHACGYKCNVEHG